MGVALYHYRRYGRYQNRFGNASLWLPMPCDVARHLASAGRMTDVDRVAKVESLSHGRVILCVVIHVVAPIHLCGASVATPIVRNDTISMRMEAEHLCIRSDAHTSELHSLMRNSYA